MATDVVSREAHREFPRWPIATSRPVRVDLGPAGSGQLVDISFGGLRVKSFAPLRRDAEIPLRIELPEKPSVESSGVVVWSKPSGFAGIRFHRMTEEQKALLRGWLTELEQAASESSPQRDEFTRITAQITAMKLNNADALSLIARRVSQLTSASGVSIAIGKPENMICMARCGDAAELGMQINPSLSLTGECVRGRRPVVCHDASTDPRAADLKQGSALILPLLVNTELRGVLQVFSQRPHAFDASTMEMARKLADAVLYVTHNVTPQRRLATVTPIARSATSSAPVVPKRTDSGKLKAVTDLKPHVPISVTAPPATPITAAIDTSAPVQNVEVAPLAEAIQVSAGTSPRSFGSPELVKPMAAPRPVAVSAPFLTYQPRAQSAGKSRIVVAVAALLLAGVGGFSFWQHRESQAVAAAATESSTDSLSVATTARAETVVPATPSKTLTAKPVAFVPTATSANIETAAIAKKPSIPAASMPDKKVAIVEEQAPRTPAMVIASGKPVERPTAVDDNIIVPSATQLAVRTSPTMPGIAMPVATSAPRLLAPRTTTWTGGHLLQRASPVYPSSAIARHIEGEVRLQGVVTSKGTVEKIRAIDGNLLLVQAATDAVRRWRYEPFKADGVPTDREITITLIFKIPR